MKEQMKQHGEERERGREGEERATDRQTESFVEALIKNFTNLLLSGHHVSDTMFSSGISKRQLQEQLAEALNQLEELSNADNDEAVFFFYTPDNLK